MLLAREMYLVGVSEEELRPDPKPEGPKTPRGKWENFWYHYKWYVAAAAFALFVIGVIVWEAVTKVEPDYRVALVTKEAVSEEALLRLEIVLEQGAVDRNGDGEVTVDVENLVLGQYVGGTMNSMSGTYSQKLVAYFQAGDPMFFIFDEPCYTQRIRELLNGEALFDTPPTEQSGISPTEGYWNWSGTELQKSFEETLPEELYFGVRKATGTAASAQEMHDADMELLLSCIARSNQAAP